MSSSFETLGEYRFLKVTCNPIDGLIVLQEQLDEEINTVTLSFEEANRAFNLVFNSLVKTQKIS